MVRIDSGSFGCVVVLVVADDAGFVICDCVNTTKDSFDLGFDGEIVREEPPFLEVGITRFTRGVWRPCLVVFS